MTADDERAVVEHIIELWEEAGELLALIEVIPEVDFLLVENIAVRPDRQGRGGEKLLHHAEQFARSWVSTRSNSTQTRRLRRTFNSTPVADTRNFNE
jgi:GNAT superfamily N-acetyltransferase